MAQELEDQGCRPLWYPTLSETEAVLQAGVDFDVAIVDFDLGGGRNGPGLVETAERKLGRHIPTLFITGGTDAKTLTELMATGRPWLTKPASPEAVRNALARLIPQHPAQAPPVEDQAPSTGPS